MSVIRALLYEAVKVAVVAWSVIALDNWLEEVLSGVDPILRYLAAAIVIALLLELLIFVAVGRPLIEISWSTTQDRAEIEGPIVAKMSSRRRATEQYTLRVSLSQLSLLGRLVLRVLFRTPPTLVIQLARTNLIPFVERSSRTDDNFPAFSALDSVHGFLAELGTPPLSTGEWHSANVRWEFDGEVSEFDRHIDLIWRASWRRRVALRSLVRLKTTVKRVKVLRR